MAIPYQEYAKVHATTFFAIQWTGFALAFVFLTFRLAVRWRTFHRLALDDGLLIFSFACFLANCILWHTELPKTYVMYGVLDGKVVPTLSIIDNVASLLRSLVAFNVLFVLCLWGVKFSFITFFWQLGKGSQGRHYWLWIVAFITLGTFAGAIGDFDWNCSRGSDLHLLTYCSSEKAKKAQAAAFRVNTAFDLLTDCLILSIPIVMVWRLHLPLTKKLVLFGLFSLTIITMLMALIRLLVVPKGRIGSDLTWSFTWSNIEMFISITVACLGAFRQLYTAKTRGKEYPISKPQPSTPSKFKISSISPSAVSHHGRFRQQPEESESQKSLYDVEMVMPGGAKEGCPISLEAIHIPGEPFDRHARNQ